MRDVRDAVVVVVVVVEAEAHLLGVHVLLVCDSVLLGNRTHRAEK